jgi:hypothetical protein
MLNSSSSTNTPLARAGMPLLFTIGASGAPAALAAVPPAWWQPRDTEKERDKSGWSS